MASIKKRKTTWYAVWTQNGKQVCKTTNIKVKGEKEKKLAQNAADALERCAKGDISLAGAVDALRKIAEITTGVSSMPTVKEYMESYVPNGGAQNKSNCKKAFELFLKHLGVNAYKRLDLLTPTICKGFVQAQLERVAYGTVRRYKNFVLTALNEAVREGVIDRNPMAVVQLHKMIPEGTKRATDREPFTMEEMKKILNTFPETWTHLVLASYLTGGQRLGDIATLKWSSVNFYTKTVHIRTKKTGKAITAPLHPRLERVLRPLYKEGEEYVFPSMAQRYSRSKGCLSVEFIALLRSAGIIPMQAEKVEGDRRPVSPKSFHSIRHTVVTQMRCNPSISADLSREIVGHASEEVERGYFTAPSQAKMDAIDFLAQQIAPASETPAEA